MIIRIMKKLGIRYINYRPYTWCLKIRVRKILHAIVIVGSIQKQNTSQCIYYEVQLSIVHLIIKSELMYKVC